MGALTAPAVLGLSLDFWLFNRNNRLFIPFAAFLLLALLRLAVSAACSSTHLPLFPNRPQIRQNPYR